MALMTVLGLVPVLGVVGVAVDLAMMTSKKQNLQDAVDIAALMAIQMPRKSEVRATFKQSLSPMAAAFLIKSSNFG